MRDARECERLRKRVATLEAALRRTLRCPSETASNPHRRCGEPGGCQGDPCEKCRLLPALGEATLRSVRNPDVCIQCSQCGKDVSTPVPSGTIVRAWVECPECVDAEEARP